MGSTIIFVLILSFLYVWLPDPHDRETIRFVAILIGGGSAIYSAYYSGAGLRSRIAQEKVTHAQEFIDSVYDVGLTEFRIKLGKDFDSNKIPPEEQYSKISENDETVAAVRISFNLFESLSIAIQHGYADEIIAQKALGFIICNMFRQFTPYIETVRTRNNNSQIYCEVEKLYNAWNAGNFLYSGKVILN
jgi:hypothetical protein